MLGLLCVFRFLPLFCPQFQKVDLEDEPESAGTKKANNRRLDISDWQMAWDRYALAAAALNQFSYKKAMEHKALVLEISANAPAGQSLLGVFFDEVARCIRCKRM